MSSDLIWPLICLIVGLILLVAEVFVPSGGLIGLLAIGLLIVSLGLAFAQSMNRGLAFLVALLLMLRLDAGLCRLPLAPDADGQMGLPEAARAGGDRPGGPRHAARNT